MPTEEDAIWTQAVTKSLVDNRNSSAAKRARTDGGRGEDDWTCPSCGNVNFFFRTTCYMRTCTQPRQLITSRNLLQSQSKRPRVTYLHLHLWGLVHLPPFAVYGMPPMMDQYGLGFPVSPSMGLPRPGFFPES
ncbi:hypothetical protein AAHA92_12353 [Salvia divinorum]|uniref:RanBP2-type domain-containing protein n=1 Tax=Salvia divinorum TaxID=28513 RepID=A0ABD1HMK0_SALDI